MIAETERLYIEKATPEDAGFFMTLMNSPNWLTYIGDRNIKTAKDAEGYILKSLMVSYRDNQFGLYKMVLKELHQPIGICGFLQRDYLDYPDLGFAILPEYEARGYTFEAATAVLKFGAERLNFKQVLAVTTEENLKSCRLLSRLGFTRTGTVKPGEGTNDFLVFAR